MNLRPLVAPLAALTLLLALAAAAMRWMPDLVVPDTFSVRPVLPEHVGEWSGNRVLFCQNEQCLRHYEAPELNGQTACPACGGTLDEWAPGERNLLPADTLLVRRMYRAGSTPPIQVSIVFSGVDQKSIHRPQQCLRGQGQVIEHSRTEEIPVPGRAPLRLMVLTVRPQGRGVVNQGLFGYWFVGGQRETPYHLSRLFWMSWDRLVHGRADRWAYVSVYSPHTGAQDAGLGRIRIFLRELAPHLVVTPQTPQTAQGH